MKVLFANEYIYPNVVSGAEFSMQLLAEALTKKGVDVVFFGPNLSKKRINFYKKIKIIHFPFFKKISPYHVLSPGWFNNPLFWLYSAFFLIITCYKEKIDIIQVHGKYILPAAIITKLFLKIPVIATARDYNYLCPLALCLTKQQKACNLNYFLSKEIKFYLLKYANDKKYISKYILVFRILIAKILQFILFYFLKLSDKIVCISQSIVHIYEKSNIPGEKLIRIYNLPPKVSNKRKNNNKQLSVLYVGKISYGKGTDLLIKAVRKVREKLPKIKLILVGKKSPSIPVFPKFVVHYKQLPHEYVYKFFQQASVYCFPSRWPEPLGRSTLEAMSNGLPLILSNKGANPELVTEAINGFLVKNNTDDIAAKIIKILKNKNMRRTMGEESLKIIRDRFNEVKIVEDHIKLYKRYKKIK